MFLFGTAGSDYDEDDEYYVVNSFHARMFLLLTQALNLSLSLCFVCECNHVSLFREAEGLISQRARVNTAINTPTSHTHTQQTHTNATQINMLLLNLLLQSLQMTCRDLRPSHHFCL